MRKILITGGSGYLGAVAASVIAYAGLKPVCFDKAPKPVDWDEYARKNANKVEFVQGDVTNVDHFLYLAKEADGIVHLAFIVGGEDCRNNPAAAEKVAIQGTENAIRAACEKSIPIIFASSDVIYGDGAETSVIAENAPLFPASRYARLKLDCERMIAKSQSIYTILRFPSSYGYSPSHRMNQLVHSFASDLMERNRLEIFQPETTRSLVEVRDAASSIVHVLKNAKRCSCETFNVASGAWSKREIAETVASIFGGQLEFRRGNKTGSNEKRDFVLDCSKLRSTGWNPRYDLKGSLADLQRRLSAHRIECHA